MYQRTLGELLWKFAFVVILAAHGIAADKQPTHVLSGHTSRVMCVCVSPNAKSLASGAVDGSIRLWQLENPMTSIELPKHERAVSAIDISPDGRLLATSSFDRKINLSRLSDKKPVKTVNLPALVWAVQFVDGGTFVTGSGIEVVRSSRRNASGRLDILALSDETSKQTRLFDDIVVSLSFAPQPKRLAVGCYDGKCTVFDMPSMSVVSTFTSEHGLTCAAMSNDGQFVAIPRHADRGIEDSNARPAAVHTEIQIFNIETANVGHILSGHDAPVMSIAFSPDSQCIATASLDRTARLWDVGTGEFLETFRHPSQVWSITFVDADTIATGLSNGDVCLWRREPR
jgi:WD40 repeat protein